MIMRGSLAGLAALAVVAAVPAHTMAASQIDKTVTGTVVIPAVAGELVTVCVDTTCQSVGPVQGKTATLKVQANAEPGTGGVPTLTPTTTCNGHNGRGFVVTVPARTATAITAALTATVDGTTITRSVSKNILATQPTTHGACAH